MKLLFPFEKTNPVLFGFVAALFFICPAETGFADNIAMTQSSSQSTPTPVVAVSRALESESLNAAPAASGKIVSLEGPLNPVTKDEKNISDPIPVSATPTALTGTRTETRTQVSKTALGANPPAESSSVRILNFYVGTDVNDGKRFNDYGRSRRVRSNGEGPVRGCERAGRALRTSTLNLLLPTDHSNFWTSDPNVKEGRSMMTLVSKSAGISSAPTNIVVTFDFTAPTGSIAINGGTSFTQKADVTLNLTAGDAWSGVDAMSFSMDGGWNWTQWEPFAPTKTLTLPPGFGFTEIGYRVRDKAGHTSTHSVSFKHCSYCS